MIKFLLLLVVCSGVLAENERSKRHFFGPGPVHVGPGPGPVHVRPGPVHLGPGPVHFGPGPVIIRRPIYVRPRPVIVRPQFFYRVTLTIRTQRPSYVHLISDLFYNLILRGFVSSHHANYLLGLIGIQGVGNLRLAGIRGHLHKGNLHILVLRGAVVVREKFLQGLRVLIETGITVERFSVLLLEYALDSGAVDVNFANSLLARFGFSFTATRSPVPPPTSIYLNFATIIRFNSGEAQRLINMLLERLVDQRIISFEIALNILVTFRVRLYGRFENQRGRHLTITQIIDLHINGDRHARVKFINLLIDILTGEKVDQANPLSPLVQVLIEFAVDNNVFTKQTIEQFTINFGITVTITRKEIDETDPIIDPPPPPAETETTPAPEPEPPVTPPYVPPPSEGEDIVIVINNLPSDVTPIVHRLIEILVDSRIFDSKLAGTLGLFPAARPHPRFPFTGIVVDMENTISGQPAIRDKFIKFLLSRGSSVYQTSPESLVKYFVEFIIGNNVRSIIDITQIFQQNNGQIDITLRRPIPPPGPIKPPAPRPRPSEGNIAVVINNIPSDATPIVHHLIEILVDKGIFNAKLVGVILQLVSTVRPHPRFPFVGILANVGRAISGQPAIRDRFVNFVSTLGTGVNRSDVESLIKYLIEFIVGNNIQSVTEITQIFQQHNVVINIRSNVGPVPEPSERIVATVTVLSTGDDNGSGLINHLLDVFTSKRLFDAKVAGGIVDLFGIKGTKYGSVDLNAQGSFSFNLQLSISGEPESAKKFQQNMQKLMQERAAFLQQQGNFPQAHFNTNLIRIFEEFALENSFVPMEALLQAAQETFGVNLKINRQVVRQEIDYQYQQQVVPSNSQVQVPSSLGSHNARAAAQG